MNFIVAGADGNRTHQGRDTPPTGFEDRARHQTTNYSLMNIRILGNHVFIAVAGRA
jgi:hypothetical protein